LSSSYVTQQIQQDPTVTNKRLGDGFYEQRFVRDQIVALTGNRFLTNYSNDETQYQALLNNGIAFAQQYNLRPGINLSEAQMAKLTTNMVWLEAQDVQLADGSYQQVLVPKVYALVGDGALLPSGALLSGNSINIDNDNFTNSGSIVSRTSIDINTGDFSDIGGRLQAVSATVDSRNDIIVEGSQWRVDDSLSLTADRDITIRGATDTQEFKNSSRTDVTRRADITLRGTSGNGELTIAAGRNAAFSGASITNNGTGDTTIEAGNNLTVDELNETVELKREGLTWSTQNAVTSSIRGGGNVNLRAGNSLNLRGAEIDAGDNLALEGKNITIDTAENRSSSDLRNGENVNASNFIDNKTTDLNADNDISFTATNDLSLRGTNATAGNDLSIDAGGDVEISVAQDEAYVYSKQSEKKSWGRKSTTLKESFTTTNVGGEFTAGNNLTINSTINNDGSVTANANSGDVTIVGSDLTAENQVAIAGDSVIIADKKEISFSREETFKRGFGGLSTKSTGQVNRSELIDSSSIDANQRNLDIISASNISIIGSDITSGGDLNLTAVDDLIITADQALSQAQKWSKETKFLSSTSSLYEREDKVSGSATSTVVASNINAGGDITINSGRARVVGSDLTAGNNINVTTDIGDIVIESAQSSTESYSNETIVKVGLSDVLEQLVDVEALADSLGDGQAKMSIAKATYDKIDTQTTATNHRASQLVANNNVTLASVGDIAITGSDIIADADNSQQGDAALIAGGDVIIKETADISDTQTDEVHGKGELSFVVQHQAVEIAKAAVALKEAAKQLKTAKEDYRKYEKDLGILKTQRDQLQTDYSNKVPGLMYEDIVDINSLIDEVESDKEWYQAGIVLAAANLVGKTTLLIQQTAAGAASVATWGFNAGVQLDLEASKTETKTHSEMSRGSLLSGNNITIQTGNKSDITKTATQITGSHLQAAENINITTGELTVDASRDENSHNTKNEQASIRIAQTIYGAVAGGPTVSVSYSRSKAESGDTTYNNSTLNANNITLSSTGDTTIKGANIKAEDTLTLDVGENLIVQSQQNRYSANNKSFGISAGFSLGSGGTGDSTTAAGAAQNLGKTDGNVSSVNGGLNASSGRSRTKQTVLTDLIGETVNINVGDNTALIGATIAAKDADGKDNGQLSLTTDTFDFGDLSNTHYDSQRSAGFSTSVGFGGTDKAGTDTADAASSSGAGAADIATLGSEVKQSTTSVDGKGSPKLNTTNIAYSNSSSYSKSKTLATLGEGTVTVADDQATGEDSTERLNRDTNNTTKELYSIDRQQGNVDLTIDDNLVKTVKAGIDLAGQAVEYLGNQVEAMGADLTPEMQANLAQSGEQAIDALIKEGLSAEEANQFLRDHPQVMITIAGLQVTREALEGKGASSTSDAVPEGGHDSDGQLTIRINCKAPTVLYNGVCALGEGQRYLDDLYETNPTAAQMATIAISAATGGPVKAIISEGLNQTVNAIAGDAIGDTMNAVTAYGGTAITDKSENVDEFIQAAEDHDSKEALIQDGTRFALGTILGIGGLKGGSKLGAKNTGGDAPNGTIKSDISEATPDKTNTVGRSEGYNTDDLSKVDQKTLDRFERLNKKDRTGEDFTKAGKENVKDINKQLNDGTMKCEGCDVEVIPPKQHRSGETPPSNEAHVDHVDRKREGGSGTPDNGQVLCRDCNVTEKH
jgi:hypothetical protein